MFERDADMSSAWRTGAPRKAPRFEAVTLILLGLLAAACTSDTAENGSAVECAQFRPDPENPFFPVNRIYTDPTPLEWETTDPGEVGVNSVVLEEAAEEVALSPVAASLLVARHGELIFERYFNGSDASDAMNLHSLTKSITSVLTGIAIDDGLFDLDTRVDEILPADLVVDHGQLTVQDLLTMSGGLEVPVPDGNYEWEPSDVPGEPSLIRAVLASRRIAEPGAEFAYNTGLTDVLAAVVAEATGMSLCEYAADRLLGPLGIEVDGWHVEPGGYFSGGSGMFITPREIARFGQLVLDEGVFEGKRLVSESWLDESLTSRWELGCLRIPVTQRYGFLWWGFDIGGHDVWMASGFGSQDVAIVPDLDLVTVITHDTIQEGGARVPMPALLHELLLGAVEGQTKPLPTEECLAKALTMATVAVDRSDVPSPVPAWPANIFGPLSPDGNEIAFSKVYLGFMDLYTIQVDGTQERRIIHDATPDTMPSWSADGTQLAFARGEPSQSDLYLIAPDGSGLEQVTDLDGYEQGPTWSPDGKRFAFIWGHRDVNGWGHIGELWVVDRDGSDLQRLRKEDTSNPAWSPDGRHIVFDSIEGDGHIGLLDLDTGLTTDLGEGFFPRWSPDGTRIVFGVLDDEGGSDVYIMMADGSDRTQLTSDPAFDTAPQWSPDGTTIIYWTTAPRGG